MPAYTYGLQCVVIHVPLTAIQVITMLHATLAGCAATGLTEKGRWQKAGREGGRDWGGSEWLTEVWRMWLITHSLRFVASRAWHGGGRGRLLGVH